MSNPTAEEMIDAILNMQAEMDIKNIPQQHRALYVTPDQLGMMKKTLGAHPSHLRGRIQSAPQRPSDLQMCGMPVICEPEDWQPEPLAQAEMDELASVLTEAVLLLRAGDERGAMAKLEVADGQCEVRVMPRAYPREKTATEIQARQYGMMYGKSMSSMMENAHRTMASLQRAQVGMMKISPEQMQRQLAGDKAKLMGINPALIDDEAARKALLDLNIQDKTKR